MVVCVHEMEMHLSVRVHMRLVFRRGIRCHSWREEAIVCVFVCVCVCVCVNYRESNAGYLCC